MDKLLYIPFLVFYLVSCNGMVDKKQGTSREHEAKKCTELESCDSLFYHQNGLILCLEKLKKMDRLDKPNYVFKAVIESGDSCMEVYSDSVYSRTGELRLEDYNNDGIADILIQCESDVRSNWTYNLYLVNSDDLEINKVKNFPGVKNPKSKPKYGLVESYVVSGKNYYHYFKIEGDSSICKFDTIIYDDIDSKEPDNKHDSIIRELDLIECLPYGKQ